MVGRTLMFMFAALSLFVAGGALAAPMAEAQAEQVDIDVAVWIEDRENVDFPHVIVANHGSVAARDVRVVIEHRGYEVALGDWQIGLDELPGNHLLIYDPDTDPSRLVWVVETLPGKGEYALPFAEPFKLVGQPEFAPGVRRVVRMITRIESVAPPEPGDKQDNNYFETLFYSNDTNAGYVIVGNYGVEATVRSRSGTPRSETVVFEIIPYVNVHSFSLLTDTVVKVELTPGLEYVPEAEANIIRTAGETILNGTAGRFVPNSTENAGKWEIGPLPNSDAGNNSYLKLTLEAALDADSSDNEQCLTATITGLPQESPNDENDAVTEDNIARVCIDPQQPETPVPTVLTDGEVSLFTWYDCVGQTDYPCDAANNANNDGFELVVVPGVKSAGTTILPEEILQPRDFVVHVPDPQGRHIAGSSISWSTGYNHSRNAYDRPGVELLAKTDHLDYMVWGVDPSSSGKTKAVITGGYSGAGNNPAPGALAAEYRTSRGSLRSLWPATNGVINLGTTGTIGLDVFRLYFTFDSLGTYEYEYTVTACYGATVCRDADNTNDVKHSDTETYTFHVGPIADLAVASAWQTAHGVAVAVVNNGPDPSPRARVELDTGGSCAIEPLPPITRVATCTIAGAQVDEGRAMVSIVDKAPYEVCANLHWHSHDDPISEANIDANEVECDADPEGSWLSIEVYDPDPNNDTSGLTDTPPIPGEVRAQSWRTTESVDGHTVTTDVRSHRVSWEPLEELYGWDVSHYEVERLGLTSDVWQPIAAVVTPPYDDTDEERGSSPRYRVRAVNVLGQFGPWAETGVSSASSLPRLSLVLDKKTINEPDDQATVTARLNKASGQDVPITVSAELASGSDTPEQPSFTLSDNKQLMIPARMRESKGIVTITANADDDGLNEQVRVSAVAAYVQSNIPAVTLTIQDDDAPGLKLIPMSVAVDEGMTADDAYTVALNAAPTGGDVVVSLTGSGDVTPSPRELTSTANNWDRPRTVDVIAVQDADDMAAITHSIVRNQSANEYGSVADATVQVAVTDDDKNDRGVMVTPDELTVEEGLLPGKTYTVRLGTEPAGKVCFNAALPAGSDVRLDRGSASLSFTLTSGNWQEGRTMTVRAVNDLDDDNDMDDITHTINPNCTTADEYDGWSVASVAVTVIDDDAPGVGVSKQALSIAEGGSGSYNVSLNTLPTADVTITVSSDNGDVTVDPPRLTFTPDNWSSVQQVTVSAERDSDAANDTAMLSHEVSSTDDDYNSVQSVASVAVNVTDPDRPGVTIGKLSPSVVYEEGRLEEIVNPDTERTLRRDRISEAHPSFYTVRLATEPTGPVVVDLTSSNSDVTLDPPKLTFDQDNLVRTVRVEAMNGDYKDSDKVTITHTVDAAASADEYDGLAIPSLDFTVDDNRDAGVTLILSEPLVVSENGQTTAEYEVVLDSQPDGIVVITIESGDPDKVDVSDSVLYFSGIQVANGRTWPDWDEPQTITVKAFEAADAGETVTLTHKIADINAHGWDVRLVGIEVGEVMVTVRDAD